MNNKKRLLDLKGSQIAVLERKIGKRVKGQRQGGEKEDLTRTGLTPRKKKDVQLKNEWEKGGKGTGKGIGGIGSESCTFRRGGD